jgi:diketogulonate reductase-like aldo/keto reductase
MLTGKFSLAPDMIDPALVPSVTLRTGAKMPAVGFGTFGSDKVDAKTMASCVREAVSLGYRHIDCARVYSNEAEIGAALEDILSSGMVRREDLWITSKVWNDMHGRGDVLLSCAQTLRDLGLDYLDLFLIHWPFPNHHAPGCDVSARGHAAQPYIHENYMRTWRQMERLVKAGLVRHIGVSNMTEPKLRLLLRDAEIMPSCSEMELHPHFQQPEFFKLTKDSGTAVIGYCPIGSPNRPERDKTPEDTCDIEDPVIVEIARRLKVHPAVVCVKWAVQRGQVPIPLSTKRSNMRANLEASITEPLTAAEMRKIASIDKNCRLIKGQVFLWKGSGDWRDLWDEDGVIKG